MGNDASSFETKQQETKQNHDALASAASKIYSTPQLRYIQSEKQKIMNRSSTMKAKKEVSPILAGVRAKINRYANRQSLFMNFSDYM